MHPVCCYANALALLILNEITGSVWKAFSILTGRSFAVKMKGLPADKAVPLLVQYEDRIYRLLTGAHEGIPRIHWSGIDGPEFVIVMDLLGPTLHSLRKMCRGSFNLRTICMLAEQMVRSSLLIPSWQDDRC